MFVCTGNICRSPSAEAVMRDMALAAQQSIEVASSGLQGYHVGEGADPRSVAMAVKRGYDMKSLRAQRFEMSDFDDYDLILAMDEGHFTALSSHAQNDEQRAKVHLFADFCASYPSMRSVPDPYYGAEDGFRRVLDMIEDGCKGLLQHFKA